MRLSNLLFIFILSLISCQNSEISSNSIQISDCDILKEASLAYCKEDYQTALKQLILLKSKYPNYTLIEEVNQKIGELYLLTNNIDSAINISTSVLERPHLYQDSSFHKIIPCETSYDTSQNGSCMRLIFPEKNNISHNASITLYKAYMKQGDFKNALNQLNLSKEQYLYYGSCGNEISMQKMAMAFRFSDLYEKMSNTDKAIKVLIPNCFPDCLEGVDSEDSELITINHSSSEAIEKVVKLAIKNNQIENIKKELTKSLDNLTTEKINNRTYYYINLMENKIFTGFSNLKKVKQAIISSDFYKKIMTTPN